MMSTQKQQHEIDRFQVERLILFSDAVFAIAITLLIIEIKIPHLESATGQLSFAEANNQLTDAMLNQIPLWIGFLVSFSVIGAYWNSHHRMFAYVDVHDGKLIFLNFVFLMTIVVMPFSSAFFSEFVGFQTPFIFYALNVSLTGICQWLIWRYISHHKGTISRRVTAADRRYGNARSIVVPALFLFSIVLYFILKTNITPLKMATIYASWSWFLLFPLSFLIRKIYGKK